MAYEQEGASQPNIERRIEAERSIAKEGVGYINNFRFRLPGPGFGGKPQYRGDDYRQLEAFIGRDPDIPYEKQTKISLDDSGLQSENRHSSFYLGLTPREFYKIIDEVLADTGITRDVALDLRKNLKERKMDHKEVNEKLVPAYLKLIEMGFTWHDISG